MTEKFNGTRQYINSQATTQTEVDVVIIVEHFIAAPVIKTDKGTWPVIKMNYLRISEVTIPQAMGVQKEKIVEVPGSQQIEGCTIGIVKLNGNTSGATRLKTDTDSAVGALGKSRKGDRAR